MPSRRKGLCEACDRLLEEHELDEIEDLTQRVDAGELMPLGQCPDGQCASLVHLVGEGSFTARGVT